MIDKDIRLCTIWFFVCFYRVACTEGHGDVAEYLLQQGADLNYRDADGRSTLYVLALENHLDTATFLLTHGAHVEAADLEGRTPLHVAAWQGHFAMVTLLLKHKVRLKEKVLWKCATIIYLHDYVLLMNTTVFRRMASQFWF